MFGILDPDALTAIPERDANDDALGIYLEFHRPDPDGVDPDIAAALGDLIGDCAKAVADLLGAPRSKVFMRGAHVEVESSTQLFSADGIPEDE